MSAADDLIADELFRGRLLRIADGMDEADYALTAAADQALELSRDQGFERSERAQLFVTAHELRKSAKASGDKAQEVREHVEASRVRAEDERWAAVRPALYAALDEQLAELEGD